MRLGASYLHSLAELNSRAFKASQAFNASGWFSKSTEVISFYFNLLIDSSKAISAYILISPILSLFDRIGIWFINKKKGSSRLLEPKTGGTGIPAGGGGGIPVGGGGTPAIVDGGAGGIPAPGGKGGALDGAAGMIPVGIGGTFSFCPWMSSPCDVHTRSLSAVVPSL